MDKKYWFFGSKLNTALLLVLIILMVLALRVMKRNEAVYFPSLAPSASTQAGPTDQSQAQTQPSVLGNKDDLVSLSVAPGAAVSGKMTVTGSVKNNYFFEGNIPVHVLDAAKNHVLETHGTSTTDWMTSGPVSFSAVIDFTTLPKGPGYIELHNDNPSGDPTKEKTIDIPIVIK